MASVNIEFPVGIAFANLNSNLTISGGAGSKGPVKIKGFTIGNASGATITGTVTDNAGNTLFQLPLANNTSIVENVPFHATSGVTVQSVGSTSAWATVIYYREP